jgi:hypothetical protein
VVKLQGENTKHPYGCCEKNIMQNKVKMRREKWLVKVDHPM